MFKCLNNEREPTYENVSRLRKGRKELDELLISEEIMWRQRSRVQWMRGGDKNTEFFHSRASTTKKKNRISKLQDDNGE